MKTKVQRFVIPASSLVYDSELEEFSERISQAVDAVFALRELRSRPVIN